MPQRSSERVCSKATLLGASFETGNHGVSALASGTIASLLHTFKDVDIRFLDYGTVPVVSQARLGEGSVPISSVLLRFSSKPWQPNHVARLLVLAALLRLVRSERLRGKLISRNAWLLRLSETQICLSIGAGDSFSDIYGMRRLLYVALPQILVLLLGKPLVLLPQTYGPFRGWLACCIARFILRRARLVCSRDREGVEVVAKLLGSRDSRVRFGYDMGLALEPLPPPREVLARLQHIKGGGGPLVGFNVSGLLYMGGYTRNNMFGLATDYPRLVHALLNEFIERKGLQVMLVPHVFGGPENPESDETACARIVEKTAGRYDGRLHFLPGRFDQHQIKYLIGQCDFFVGSRMHACIAALSQGIPALGLAYSRKFAGVLESLGGGSRLVDLRKADKDQVLSAVGEALRDKRLLRLQLEERMPKIKESVLNLFSGDEFKDLLAQTTT